MRGESIDLTDAELLRASRAGSAGFETFYRRHLDAVLSFHARRVRDPERAADLTAETFAAALLALHDHGRAVPEAPVAWLFTIAHRRLIDSYRHGRVEDQARRRLAIEPVALEDEDIERINELAHQPDLALELADRLPADQRDALIARVIDERDYADIAAEMNASEASIRMRVSRALSTLRTALDATTTDLNRRDAQR